MLRTQIPVSVWEQEGDAVIATAVRLLNAAEAGENAPARPQEGEPQPEVYDSIDDSVLHELGL